MLRVKYNLVGKDGVIHEEHRDFETELAMAQWLAAMKRVYATRKDSEKAIVFKIIGVLHE